MGITTGYAEHCPRRCLVYLKNKYVPELLKRLCFQVCGPTKQTQPVLGESKELGTDFSLEVICSRETQFEFARGVIKYLFCYPQGRAIFMITV